MRQAVRDGFISFTDRFEGDLNYLYTDGEGLVTTGRGNLVDFGLVRLHPTDEMGASNPAPAMGLPWKGASGTYASPVEIRMAWWAVKTAWPAVQSVACSVLTKIRLDQSAVDDLTWKKLDAMWGALAKRFTGIETWPASAQLGVISMCWAMGPNRFDKFPRFCDAARRQDWATCALECTMTGVGVEPRNAANCQLFIGSADANVDALAIT